MNSVLAFYVTLNYGKSEIYSQEYILVPQKYIHKNLDSVAKTDSMQIWLHIHTYEEIVLGLREVFWNAFFLIQFYCPAQQTVKIKGPVGKMGQRKPEICIITTNLKS